MTFIHHAPLMDLDEGFNHDLHAQSAVLDGSSGSLDRSFASAHAAGRRALTISAVVKTGTNGTVLASSPAGDNYVYAGIGTEGQVHFWDWRTGYQFRLTTSGQFASPLAHCHIVWVLDTDNATQADRARIYVNGVRDHGFLDRDLPGGEFRRQYHDRRPASDRPGGWRQLVQWQPL